LNARLDSVSGVNVHVSWKRLFAFENH
jgi:hypothetical protein